MNLALTMRATAAFALLVLLAGCPGRVVDTAGNVARTAIKTTGAVVAGAVKVLTFATAGGPR